MGSYFGSSLCAVDLNADGLSDLLVGAPMFSEIRDEGQVTVYINRGNVSTVLGIMGMGCGRWTLVQRVVTEPHHRGELKRHASHLQKWKVICSFMTANLQCSRKI